VKKTKSEERLMRRFIWQPWNPLLEELLPPQCRHHKRKKAVRFDSKQDDWCRLDTFKDMYDDVYERLWEAGIA
jgi:hypothetical protein